MSVRWISTMLSRVEFDSGTVLMPGNRVVVTMATGEGVAIEWDDHEGHHHVAGVHRDLLSAPILEPSS